MELEEPGNPMSNEKIEILHRVARGEIGVEEGNRLLAELEAMTVVEPEVIVPEPDSPDVKIDMGGESRPEIDPDELKRMKAWRRWNWIPLSVFLILTGFAALWIYQAYTQSGFGWAFWLSWIPFLIGILGVFAFWNMKWVHVRVREKKGERVQKVSISVPLPLGILPWLFNTFGRYMPLEVQRQRDSILMINEVLKSDEPIHVHVTEKEDEEVEVFIG